MHVCIRLSDSEVVAAQERAVSAALAKHAAREAAMQAELTHAHQSLAQLQAAKGGAGGGAAAGGAAATPKHRAPPGAPPVGASMGGRPPPPGSNGSKAATAAALAKFESAEYKASAPSPPRAEPRARR